MVRISAIWGLKTKICHRFKKFTYKILFANDRVIFNDPHNLQ